MKLKLLEILRCPTCEDSPLTLTAQDGKDDVRRGKLTCEACKGSFPIRDGVPFLLTGGHLENSQDDFALQWALRADGAFESDGRLFTLTHDHRISQYETLFADALQPPESGRRWFLDAGCGPAEALAKLAERHPKIEFVGLDFTDAAERAAARFAHLENLHFVRGDVAHLPFGDVFDGVLSYGVLHCLPFDTKEAFVRLSQVAAPGGRVVTWIYPALSDMRDPLLRLFWSLYYGMRDVVFLERGHRLPSKLRLNMLRAILMPAAFATPLWVINRIDPFQFTSKKDFYRCALFMAFDDVSPEFQRRHSAAEVTEWYRELGFEDAVPWTEMDSRNWCGLYVGRRPTVTVRPSKDQTSRASVA